MSPTQGTFVWYDLTTTDVNAAIEFYRDVVGWRTQRFDDDYTVWTAGETGIGGVVAARAADKRPITPPHWMGYVLADDVDALTKSAESLGATIQVPPSDIPTVGRFSIVADPQGATLALFTPLPRETEEPARPSEPPPGHVSWNELMTDDPEAALRFYGRLFGWEQTSAVESPMGVYRMYGKGGRTFGGIGQRPADFPLGPRWLYYVKVADLDGALVRVRQRGGNVLHGPMEVPGGDHVAQCADPQGAAFALHGR